MTQLPELEVLKRDLEKDLVGKRLKEVWLSPAELCKRHGTIKDFSASLEDRKILGMERVGRCLLFDLDDEHTWVLVPGSRARLTKETAKEVRGKYTRAVLSFATGGSIHYHDEAVDGETFVIDSAQKRQLPEVTHLGLDPMAEPIPWPVLANALVARADMLKAVLVDDSFVVGLGDVYADEVLFEAGLAPDRSSETLSSQEVRRLHRAVLEVVHEAVKQGGCDQPPEDGSKGFIPYADLPFLKIYGREGRPDARSRSIITYSKLRKNLFSYHSPGTQT